MQSAVYTVIVDNAFSADMSAQLSDYVTHHADMSTQLLCNQLKKQFAAIKECSARLYADGTCALAIVAKKPLIKLSSDIVLTHEGTSTELALWNAKAVADLATITIKQSFAESDGKALAAYIKSMPPHYFQHYDICWNNKHEISFYDKERKIFFLSDITTMPDDSFCQSLNEIISGMEIVKNKKQKQLVADIRFERQLIIYEKRGAYHGNSIF